VPWDARLDSLVIQILSGTVQDEARERDDQWAVTWGCRPWCRASAQEEDAATRVLRGVWL
jgi:hypothetical protein